MRKVIVASVFILLSSQVFAWTIGPMNYQGRLLDDSGIPVTGSYNFKVRIYDAASGGTLKFSEQQNSIAVNDGVYSFLVSTGTNSTGAWDIALWNTPQLFLEIEVNGETLSPRHLMAATPYAYQANLALTTNNALALGGTSAAQYNSTLQAICVSSKGKWLELANNGAGACLGAGTKYPGPSMVAVSVLTASLDFTNLDLTNADVSGIDFGNANLSGSLLKNTVVQTAGIDSVNFTDAILDHVLPVGSGAVNANFTRALVGNMDPGYWNLSGANLTGVSAAMLTNCLLGLPAGYACKGKNIGGGNYRYFIVGPGVNFSATSLMAGKMNTQYTDQWSFQDSDLRGIDYSGNKLESVVFPPYNTMDMSNSNFKGASIRNTKLPGILSGSSFDGVTLVSSEFYAPTFAPVVPTFDNAELKFVLFNGPADNTVLTFTNAILTNIEIRGSGVPGYGQNISLSASASRIDTLAISSTLSALTITNSTVVGGINAHSSSPLGTIAIGGGTTFLGGNISGRFFNANFTGSVFYGTTFRGAMLTGATGLYPSNLLNVDWFGAICPDGYSVTTPGGTCIGHGI